MSKALSAMGILMLALLVFVGLVHVFLKVQHKDTPETLGALNAMPVIGGFFSAPPPVEPEMTAEEKRERQARQDLLDSREFFALPEGFDRDALDEVVGSMKDALESYEQGRLEVEKEKEALAKVRAEVESQRQALEEAAAALAAKAKDLEAGREELELRANRLQSEEMKNLKANASIFEQMAPAAAAAILKDIDLDTGAKILKMMSPRKSGKILGEMKPTLAVDLTRRLQAITTDPPNGPANDVKPVSTGG